MRKSPLVIQNTKVDMKKIVIYFHGYGSSPNSGKTEQLRAAGFETHSWSIDIDPEVSIPYLEGCVFDVILEHLNEDIELFFVGTSLGAWYASKIAELFMSENVFLINPSYSPCESLKKYGVEESICEKYDDLVFKNFQTVYIGAEDTVIDFDGVDFNGADFSIVDGADHRFADHFYRVIEDLTSA